MNYKIVARCAIKSKTNIDELSKQYFTVMTAENMDSSLIIRKYILASEDFGRLELLGFNLEKKFKDVRLYSQRFSIKLNTLSCVADWLTDIEAYKYI